MRQSNMRGKLGECHVTGVQLQEVVSGSLGIKTKELLVEPGWCIPIEDSVDYWLQSLHVAYSKGHTCNAVRTLNDATPKDAKTSVQQTCGR